MPTLTAKQAEQRIADLERELRHLKHPRPPEPAPPWWRLSGVGSLTVARLPQSGGVWVVFPSPETQAKLTPDEADAMADALRAHAAYARA